MFCLVTYLYFLASLQIYFVTPKRMVIKYDNDFPVHNFYLFKTEMLQLTPCYSHLRSLPTKYNSDINEINFIAKFYTISYQEVLAAQIQLLRPSRTLF